MADFCITCICGRLARKPELKKSENTVFMELSLASNNIPVYDKVTKKVEAYDCTYLDAVFYDVKAERLASYNLDKGRAIAVFGDLQLRTWTDNTGIPRQKHILKGQKFFLLAPDQKFDFVEGIPAGDEDVV